MKKISHLQKTKANPTIFTNIYKKKRKMWKLLKTILRPKNNQSYEKTLKEVNLKMNPVELKLGVSNVKKINKGAVIIKCQSKNETEI